MERKLQQVGRTIAAWGGITHHGRGWRPGSGNWGPSPYEVAAEIAPGHAEALLIRRVQDANMREVRRLTNLLLKVKRKERKIAAGVASDEGKSHDVTEKEGT